MNLLKTHDKTYYRPVERLVLPFDINTGDGREKRAVEVHIKKIYIPGNGRTITLHYVYGPKNQLELNGPDINHEIVIPLVSPFLGFFIKGGAIMKSQLHGARWKWWQACTTPDSKPDEIELVPMSGEKITVGRKSVSVFKLKSEQLGKWKKAWEAEIKKTWASVYINIDATKQGGPPFSTSFKAVEKVPGKKKKLFLFTKFIKTQEGASKTRTAESDSLKVQLKF